MKPLIFKNIIRFIRLHFLYLQISIKHLAVYRVSAFLTVVFSLVFLIAEILTVNVYYRFSERIGDWDQNSFYILLGTFNIIICLYTYFFEIPHDDFAYKVRFGELDTDLIRPMDSLAFTTIQKVDYASLFNLPIPIWLIYSGIHELDLKITTINALLYLLTLIIGVFIVYLINQFFVNFSFWTTETNNIAIASDQIVQLGSRPLQVYPRLVQFGFSYVMPIILSTNLSVHALKNELKIYTLLVLLASTAFLFLIVRIQWKLGLRHYSSASS